MSILKYYENRDVVEQGDIALIKADDVQQFIVKLASLVAKNDILAVTEMFKGELDNPMFHT
jgi:hypothetical protein